MAHPFDDDAADYVVLINRRGQHSLWPHGVDVPEGWTVATQLAGRPDWLEWIRVQWTDMRPAGGEQPADGPETPAGVAVRGRCVHELFEEQVGRTPDALAVLHGRRSLTYAELNHQANGLAALLRRRGVGPEDLVGVCGPRSSELIAGILGVLKAGGGYVPLDPSYPPDRLRHMLEDARPSLVLASAEASQALAFEGVDCVALDVEPFGSGQAAENVPSGVGPDNVAVVVYTSGSTGRPKGIAIPHRAILARFHHGYPYRAGDIQRASVSVVGHFSDLLMPLTLGSTVRIADEATVKDFRQLVQCLWRHRSSRAVFVPSQLHALLEAGDDLIRLLGRIDTVIISGEPATPALVRAFRARLPHAALINGYGAAEAAGIVTAAAVTEAETISVGRPFSSSHVYVLDRDLRPTPAGRIGDVYLAGDQLARGYLHRPDLTAERFVADPFQGDGRRMYVTGDLGVLRTDGSLEILGRDDGEVKVRGFRVNVAEIEAALEAKPEVGRAVVVSRDRGTTRQLTAYVVPRDPTRTLGIGTLRDDLRATLPSFMIPSTFRVVHELPMLPNGKIDRVRLATEAAEVPESLDPHRVTPGTPTEQVVADIWADLLNRPEVASTDRFLDLGGDSLYAIQVALRIADRFGIDLSGGDPLLDNLTAAELAAIIEAKLAEDADRSPAFASLSQVE